MTADTPHNASVTITTSDGRDIDPRLGALVGSGAGQVPHPTGPDRPVPGAGQPVYDRNPSDRPADGPLTYYGLPIVKAPPWGWPIPAYIVLGGVSGAAAALAAATQSHDDDRLTNAARWLAFGSGASGATLLLKDLGRPTRFLNMFRVFRPTSPMSMGVYILSASVGTSAVASVFGRSSGLLGLAARAAGAVAGLTGVPLTGYTAVLLGTTAMPGWNIGLSTLPPLFMSSAAATAGAALTAVPLPPGAARTVSAYRTVGQVGELAAEAAHERVISRQPRVAAAYQQQRPWKVGRWLTLGSLGLGLVPGLRRRRFGRLVVAGLGVAGSAATKVGVFYAGMATANDPAATIEQQRPA